MQDTTVTESIIKETIKNHGGTFNRNGTKWNDHYGNELGVEGWFLISRPDGLEFSEPTTNDLSDFLSQVGGDIEDFRTDINNRYDLLGTWISDGVLYVDNVTVEYNFMTAILTGNARSQQAIHDLQTGTDYKCLTNGDVLSSLRDFYGL